MVRNRMDEDRDGSRSPSPGVSRSGSRNSLNNGHCSSRTSLIHRNQVQSAKHICFFRNGDPFYRGLKLAVSAEKYKEFNSLLVELSLKVNLTTGAVRHIFDADDGRMITDIKQLHHGTAYVCSSSQYFDKMGGNYGKWRQQWSLHTKGKNLQGLTNWGCGNQSKKQSKHGRDHAAKLVTVYKNGKPPREKVTMILNHKFVSLDQVLDLLSAKETLGKVDKLYTKGGKLMRELDDLFEDDTTYYTALSSNERFYDDGLMSDIALRQEDAPLWKYFSVPQPNPYVPGLRPPLSAESMSSLMHPGCMFDSYTPRRPVSRARSVSPKPSRRLNSRSTSPHVSNKWCSMSSVSKKTPSSTPRPRPQSLLFPSNMSQKSFRPRTAPKMKSGKPKPIKALKSPSSYSPQNSLENLHSKHGYFVYVHDDVKARESKPVASVKPMVAEQDLSQDSGHMSEGDKDSKSIEELSDSLDLMSFDVREPEELSADFLRPMSLSISPDSIES